MDKITASKQEFDNGVVVIERAIPADAEAICDIRDRAWIDTYPNPELGITAEDIRVNAQGLDGEFVPRRVAHFREQIIKDNGVSVPTFVAKMDGKVVGFIDPRFDEEKRRTIGAIYVAPEAQGLGIGSKLMREALDRYGRDQDIFLEVVSYNKDAIRFYERFGFEKTDAVVTEEEGRPDYITVLPQIEMVLRAEITKNRINNKS